MSFGRVKPGGYAVNDIVSSGQLNQLDIDHANSLDKSPAGDQIGGTITIAPGAKIVAGVQHAIQATAAGGIEATFPGGIRSTVGFGITTPIAQGITTSVPGGIQPATPGGIQSGVDGGIQLSGTANDQVTFKTPRFKQWCVPVRPLNGQLFGAWTGGAVGLGGSGAAGSQFLEIPRPHDAATLVSVAIVFAVGAPHANVPAVLPSLSVRGASSIATSFNQFSPSLTDPQFFPNPGSGAAWFNSGNLQRLTFTCNQNNVVDSQNFMYWAILTDENGANSSPGNNYYFMVISYTAIGDMRFA